MRIFFVKIKCILIFWKCKLRGNDNFSFVLVNSSYWLSAGIVNDNQVSNWKQQLNYEIFLMHLVIKYVDIRRSIFSMNWCKFCLFEGFQYCYNATLSLEYSNNNRPFYGFNHLFDVAFYQRLKQWWTQYLSRFQLLY